MRLLVSVRCEAEVEPALSGGSDIIDAKEPQAGPLGAVTPSVLTGIMRRVPAEVELSVALGDALGEYRVRQAIARLPQLHRSGATYVKLGFAGIRSPRLARNLLRAAVSTAGEHPLKPRVIAVAYADWDSAESLAPGLLAPAAANAGAAGLLIDTYVKDGRTLLHLLPLRPLADLVAQARSAGLIAALAGSLEAGDLPAVRQTAPDIVGFRGAACVGSRAGAVSLRRVQLLRLAMLEPDSGFVQETGLPGGQINGAKRPKPPRNSAGSVQLTS
jgi:uncharacterized protein (UPF0264 family)